MSSSLVCAGCGWTAPALDPRPFRCARAGTDDVDHVLARRLTGATPAPFFDAEPNPFIRFRTFTHAWHTAMAIGMSDEEFVALVRVGWDGWPFSPLVGEKVALSERSESKGRMRDGGSGDEVAPSPGASRHPLPASGARGHHPGRVWIKNETHNVAGSHKARHLMGLMLWLRVAERIDPALANSRLAIASCGNAALAAATIARAYGRELDVFVPDDASPPVLARLDALGAHVTRCARERGVRGDPAYLRFREAVARGALPFTCQGNENGLVIEGGQTLGWELASQLASRGVTLDHLFIQAGGGALAAATIAALEEAHGLGVIPRMPRIHAVQTLASPLRRAYNRVLDRGLEWAVAHRSRVMWPWETPPRSIATGILDDETYDWAAVLRGVITTGGSVITVSEDELREANRLAGEGVSPTGSAGLAGALQMRCEGEVGVLFTG